MRWPPPAARSTDCSDAPFQRRSWLTLRNAADPSLGSLLSDPAATTPGRPELPDSIEESLPPLRERTPRSRHPAQNPVRQPGIVAAVTLAARRVPDIPPRTRGDADGRRPLPPLHHEPGGSASIRNAGAVWPPAAEVGVEPDPLQPIDPRAARDTAGSVGASGWMARSDRLDGILRSLTTVPHRGTARQRPDLTTSRVNSAAGASPSAGRSTRRVLPRAGSRSRASTACGQGAPHGNPPSKRWGTPSSGRMRGSPQDGGPNRLRDPFRPLSRGGRAPAPHPSPAALRAASASQPAHEGLSPQPAKVNVSAPAAADGRPRS